MTTATATPTAAAAPPRNGKKKLLVILGIAVLALVLAGAAGVVYLRHRAAAQAEFDDADVAAGGGAKAERRDPSHAPTFVPLDPFTVNLADREAERFAQVSVTLELDGPKTIEPIKVYMPVIRNNILMVLSHKTANELLEREGKTRLAREIQREVSRAIGVEVAPEPPVAAPPGSASPEAKVGAEGKAASPKKRPRPQALPVTAVHFSTFIIQ